MTSVCVVLCTLQVTLSGSHFCFCHQIVSLFFHVEDDKVEAQRGYDLLMASDAIGWLERKEVEQKLRLLALQGLVAPWRSSRLRAPVEGLVAPTERVQMWDAEVSRPARPEPEQVSDGQGDQG